MSFADRLHGRAADAHHRASSNPFFARVPRITRSAGVPAPTRQTHSTASYGRDSTADSLPGGVARAVEILSRNISEPVGVDELAQEVGVSTRQLERQFKKATGQSPSRYYRSLRMKAARQLVLFSKQSLGNIAVAVGYETVGPLQRHYREEFGISPNEDRTKMNRLRVEEARPLPSV